MDPFVGQLALFGFPFAPKGWALCQGQLLPIQQNTALFSLLGTTYGGDGRTNFALPDLRGRTAVGAGQGPGLSPYTLGSQQGVEQVQLAAAATPQHTHAFPAFAATATTNAPNGALPAQGVATGGRGGSPVNTYAPASGAAAKPLAAAQAAAAAGGNGGHNNVQPSLALNWCIALQGIYPSRP